MSSVIKNAYLTILAGGGGIYETYKNVSCRPRGARDGTCQRLRTG